MHHPAINANCTNTSVTGYLKTIKICFALLLESALERYQRRQRRVNFRDVEVKLRRVRMSVTREDREDESDWWEEENGELDCCWGRRWDRYDDVDICERLVDGLKRVNLQVVLQTWCVGSCIKRGVVISTSF
jgi:hypothetical protein